MIADHIDAFADLIDAVPNVTVYADTPVPNSPSYPYVVVYGNQGVAQNNSLSDVSSLTAFSVQTTVVAQTQDQARKLADRVRTALLDVRPTVAGYVCGQIGQLASQRVRLDPDLPFPVFYAVDTWTFTSVPA